MNSIEELVSQSRLDDSTKDAIEYVHKILTIAKRSFEIVMNLHPTAEQVIEIYDRIVDKKLENDLKKSLEELPPDEFNSLVDSAEN